MRFFSNEAKDNTDERDPDTRDDNEPGQADSAVPQQRAGSPWQHGPADSADRPVVAEPAPQPTAFGASTVGGAVAASAVAGRHEAGPDTDSTNRTTDAASGVADDRTVPLGDRPAGDPVQDDTVKDDSLKDDTVKDDSLKDDTLKDDTVKGDADRHDADRDVTADRDETGTDRLDDHSARSDSDTATGTDSARKDESPVDLALADRGTFDDPHLSPELQDDRTGKSGDDTTFTGVAKPADTSIEDTTPEVVAGAPAGDDKTPAFSGPAPFFPAADTDALRERWRDVQLRFVDDPKAATADAAGLVDEAVDKLTTALRGQRGSLSKGTDDTESLRVELRAYRDILDRLLGL